MKLTDKQERMLAIYQCQQPSELLNVFPIRYQSFEVIPKDQWVKDTTVFFEGTLVSAIKRNFIGGKRSVERFEVMVEDEIFKVTTYNRRYLSTAMFSERICILGKISAPGQIVATMVNSQRFDEQLGLKPVYPLRAGVKQHEIHRLMKKVLANEPVRPDFIAEPYRQAYRLMHYHDALTQAHFPESQAQLTDALRTLKYQEFLAYQCHMVLEKLAQAEVLKTPKIFDNKAIDALVKQLPYQLTTDQNTSLQEILKDMASERPMNRLLQGDVGSGKTIVVFLAMAACVFAGQQAALLAPTEILCEQHYEGAKKLFEPLGIEVVMITQSSKRDPLILQALVNGTARIIIGTHAIFQEDVSFKELGMIVTDEQHRFGVKQRTMFEQMGHRVDRLMLSATPIPRTLANVLYQQLDISTIQTYPSHHKPIITKYIQENSIRTILPELEQTLLRGEQIYIVSASIDESESMQFKSVKQLSESLKPVFENYRIEAIHGQLKSQKKNEIMQSFAANEVQILVATTVIEVGIDVKNATTIVIYHADRFGLSTLHQLRGRVGRGAKQGYCYVLSQSEDDIATHRLTQFEAVHDGFTLANEDLKTRGPGDMLGLRQSGLPLFALGDFFADQNIMMQAAKDAQKIIEHLDKKEQARFAKKLEQIHSMISQ